MLDGKDATPNILVFSIQNFSIFIYYYRIPFKNPSKINSFFLSNNIKL